MAVISTSNHPKALWPGVNAWFGASYKDHATEWDKLFAVESSDMAYEEDVEMTGFGFAPEKPQGSAVSYDSHTQGYTKRYTHVAYALGYIVTREEIKDNKYEKVSKKRAGALARAMRQTKEVVHANIFNRAFNSSYTGGDGKELLATDHPSLAGNWQNELTTAADLSEAALEDLSIIIMNAKDSRGLNIALGMKNLILPPNLAFEGERLMKSTLQSGTANNDINAIKSMGLFKGGIIVNHYLTDTDAWFITTDSPDGLKSFNREDVEFGKDNDFDTDNAKAKAYMRFSTGWTDPRGLYGSPGA